MRRPLTIRSSNQSRGLALPAAMMMLFVMVVLVGALVGLVGQELREVAYTGFDNRALYLADAGVQELVSLAQQASPGLATDPARYLFPPDPNGTPPAFVVHITKAAIVNNRRTYVVSSDGQSSEGYHRYVQALILEDSFAGLNYAGWSNAPGNYFVAGLMAYNGPVYLGGNNGNPLNVWWQDGAAAIFNDKVTMQGTVNWYTSGGPANPNTQADWASVDSHGSAYVQNSSTPLKFPPDASGAVIANEALFGLTGTTMPSTATKGVYVNDTEAKVGTAGGLVTGIYVNGNADIVMSASGTSANPQTETITFNPEVKESGSIPNPVVVVIDYTNNTTKVTETQGSTYTTTYTGVPDGAGSSTSGASANGAIFVNGDVTSLKGSVKGSHTIATNDNNQGTSENNVTIADNITYQNDPQTCGCTSTDMLGIISHDVLVDKNAPKNLTIEAAVFAGNSHDYTAQNGQGTFATDQLNNPGNLSKKGPLLIYGSLVNAYISPLGVFDSGSGGLQNGWADSYTWDTRFQKTSPPFYPSLNSFTIVGWKDCGSQQCT
jgi:hypothetical protein